MQYSVKFNCPDRDKTAWQLILSVLHQSGIKCARLDSTNEGFRGFFHCEKDVDSLFSNEVLQKLVEIRCSPVKPNYLTSNRTVIATKIDKFIMNHSEEEIQNDINCRNSGVLELTSVTKFPSGKTFKFVCKNVEMAARCLDKGFSAFNLCISPHCLAIEEQRQAKFCYRCYSLDGHFANNCSKPTTYKVCSLCAREGHAHKECSFTERKCLNCSGSHATTSKACKKVVEGINDRKISSSLVSSLLIPSAMSTSKTLGNKKENVKIHENPIQNGLSRDEMFRGFMCLVYATNIDPNSSGTFSENLNKLLTANNLPTLETADLPPPKIIDLSKTHVPTVQVPPVAGKDSASSPIQNLEMEDGAYCTVSVNNSAGGSAAGNLVTSNAITSRNTNLQLRSKNKNQCIIFVRQGQTQKLTKGKVLAEGINSRDVAIEHNCTDEVKCMGYLTKKIQNGDHTNLKMNELINKKFDDKYRILMSSID